MELVSVKVLDHQLAALASNIDAPGIPIVFLHGISASIHFWPASLPSWIREHMPWFSLSLPGHYPAVLPNNFQQSLVTSQMFTQTLATAIRELAGDRTVYLVGHSTGGFAALILAARVPQMVNKVLCFSGFYQGRWNGVIGILQKFARGGKIGTPIFKAMLKFATKNDRIYKLLSAFNAANWKNYFNSPYLDNTLEAMRFDAAQHDLDGLVALFSGIAKIDISYLLPQIEAPTLIVAGDRDPIIPLAQAEFLADRIPRAELQVLKGVGHMFFAECTDSYHRILMDWIQPADPVKKLLNDAIDS